MFRVTTVLGHRDTPDLSAAVDRVASRGGLHVVDVAPTDVARHRLRLVTDRGAECVVVLPRDQHLSDGAVLVLEEETAVVARLASRRWLRLRVTDPATALRLGFLAGHLHWAVRFDGTDLLVGQDEPVETYLSRVEDLISDGSVTYVGCGAA